MANRALWRLNDGSSLLGVGFGPIETDFLYAKSKIGLSAVWSPTSVDVRSALVAEYKTNLSEDGWTQNVIDAHITALTTAALPGYKRVTDGATLVGSLIRYARGKSIVGKVHGLAPSAVSFTSLWKMLKEMGLPDTPVVVDDAISYGPGMTRVTWYDYTTSGSVDAGTQTQAARFGITGLAPKSQKGVTLSTRGTHLQGVKQIGITSAVSGGGLAVVFRFWDGTSYTTTGGYDGSVQGNSFPVDLSANGHHITRSVVAPEGSNIPPVVLAANWADPSLADWVEGWISWGFGRCVSSVIDTVAWDAPVNGVSNVAITVNNPRFKTLCSTYSAEDPGLKQLETALTSCPTTATVLIGDMGLYDGKLEDTALYKKAQDADVDLRGESINPGAQGALTFGGVERKMLDYRAKWGYSRSVVVFQDDFPRMGDAVVTPVTVVLESSGSSFTASVSIPSEAGATQLDALAAFELAMELDHSAITITGPTAARTAAAAGFSSVLSGVSSRLTGRTVEAWAVLAADQRTEGVAEPWTPFFYLKVPLAVFKDEVLKKKPEFTFVPFVMNSENAASLYVSQCVRARVRNKDLT